METTGESSEICDETTMRKFSRFPKKISDFKRSQKFISSINERWSDFPTPPLWELRAHFALIVEFATANPLT
jgi:hypothetical protein